MSFEFEQIPTTLIWVVHLSFALAILVALHRLWKGPALQDRLLATEFMGGMGFCLSAWFALHYQQTVLLDITLAMAALSFIGTVALSRTLQGDET